MITSGIEKAVWRL